MLVLHTTMGGLLAAWWFTDVAVVAVILGVLAALFAAVQQGRGRRDEEPHSVLRKTSVPMTVAVAATAVVYATLAYLRRRHTSSAEGALDSAFDEAAMMRHVHRDAPGF